MISFSSRGDLKNLEKFLKSASKGDWYRQIDALAKKGVAALAAATPVDSGLTSASWDYKISRKGGGVTIEWVNRNQNGDFNVAIALQMGHGTGTGGYIRGQDYINPAIRPVFDQIADGVWKVVQSS